MQIRKASWDVYLNDSFASFAQMVSYEVVFLLTMYYIDARGKSRYMLVQWFSVELV